MTPALMIPALTLQGHARIDPAATGAVRSRRARRQPRDILQHPSDLVGRSVAKITQANDSSGVFESLIPIQKRPIGRSVIQNYDFIQALPSGDRLHHPAWPGDQIVIVYDDSDQIISP